MQGFLAMSTIKDQWETQDWEKSLGKADGISLASSLTHKSIKTMEEKYQEL